jgi:hypothetical protein
MSKDDLHEVNQYVANRFKQLDVDAASRLSIGQTVRFQNKEPGGFRTISGPIAEITNGVRLELGRCSDGRMWSINASSVLP